MKIGITINDTIVTNKGEKTGVFLAIKEANLGSFNQDGTRNIEFIVLSYESQSAWGNNEAPITIFCPDGSVFNHRVNWSKPNATSIEAGSYDEIKTQMTDENKEWKFVSMAIVETV